MDSYAQSLTKKEKNEKWGLFDKKKEVTGFIYDEIEERYRIPGYFVLQGDQWDKFNRAGELVIPCEYDQIRCSRYELYIVSKAGKFGIYSTDTGYSSKLIYDGIEFLSEEGNGIVKLDGEWVNLKEGETNTSQERVVFSSPEKMPMFPGCEKLELSYEETKKCAEQKMLEFIYTNITYPKLAQENYIEGMAVVSFIVSPEGDLSDFKILRNLDGGCGHESKRVLETMPKWVAAKHDGEPVWCQFNMPIRFKLDKSTKGKNKRKW